MRTFTYTVTAKTPSELRVSRHGIGRSRGGVVVARETFQWPHTPTYMAEEMVRDENPGCELSFQLPKEVSNAQG